MQLVEGYEYFYSFRPGATMPDIVRKAIILNGPALTTDWKVAIPDGDVIVHLRIENSGPIDLDILSITSNSSLSHGGPMYIYSMECYDTQGMPVQFPLHLVSQEIYTCNLAGWVKLGDLMTSAQFASRLRTDNIASGKTRISVQVDAIGVNQVPGKFSHDFDIKYRPIYDMIIHHWQRLGEKELLRLVGAAQRTSASAEAVSHPEVPPDVAHKL